MTYTYLSLTIRPLYDVFQDEIFQTTVIDYITKELVNDKKVQAYLISWEHGDNSDEPNHFQMALHIHQKVRSDNLKTSLITRLSKVGIDIPPENKVWFKGKVHDNPTGLIGYCWKEQPNKYLTTYPIPYLDEMREKYIEIQSGAVVATNVHIDNLIQSIEKYCDIMEMSKSQVDPWDVVKVFIKQGKLSFATFKKIKCDDLDCFWKIKHRS